MRACVRACVRERSYAQAMLPDSSGLFMLDGKSDFDGNTFNAELGRWGTVHFAAVPRSVVALRGSSGCAT